jgi:hypothetical protein
MKQQGMAWLARKEHNQRSGKSRFRVTAATARAGVTAFLINRYERAQQVLRDPAGTWGPATLAGATREKAILYAELLRRGEDREGLDYDAVKAMRELNEMLEYEQPEQRESVPVRA